jgi:hypothetical protein
MIDMNKTKKYEGLGFVELITAIGVAGVALVVLMNMAAHSMREAVHYERQDALTRLTISGALVVRKHVEDANHSKANPAVTVDFVGSQDECYEIDFEESRIKFDFSYENNIETLESEEALEAEIIYDFDESEDWDKQHISDIYFAAYCIDSIEPSTVISETDTYVGRVISGYKDCGSCGILPYEHNIVVNVKKDLP